MRGEKSVSFPQIVILPLNFLIRFSLGFASNQDFKNELVIYFGMFSQPPEVLYLKVTSALHQG